MEFKLTGGVIDIDTADFAVTLNGCKKYLAIADDIENFGKILPKLKKARGMIVCFKGNKELGDYEDMGAKLSSQSKKANVIWSVEHSKENEMLVIAGW